jgi:hypothetical protein
MPVYLFYRRALLKSFPSINGIVGLLENMSIFVFRKMNKKRLEALSVKNINFLFWGVEVRFHEFKYDFPL